MKHPPRPKVLKGERYLTVLGRAVIVDVMTWPYIKVLLDDKLMLITDSQLVRKIH